MKMAFPIVLMSASICAACVPVPVYDVPHVDGKILDSENKNPIPDAQIHVRPASQGSGTDIPESTATSDANGYFHAPEITHRIWLPPLPFDLVVPDAQVTISASGYKTQQFDFYDELKKLDRQNPTPTSDRVIFYLNRHGLHDSD
jgi:hypothetical protein